MNETPENKTTGATKSTMWYDYESECPITFSIEQNKTGDHEYG